MKDSVTEACLVEMRTTGAWWFLSSGSLERDAKQEVLEEILGFGIRNQPVVSHN